MVERSLSMREVPGSIPGASTPIALFAQVVFAAPLLTSLGLQRVICGPPGAWAEQHGAAFLDCA